MFSVQSIVCTVQWSKVFFFFVSLLTLRKIASFWASSVSPYCGNNDGGTQRLDAGGTGVSLPVTRDSGPVCLGASVLIGGGVPRRSTRSVSVLIGALVISLLSCIGSLCKL